MKKHSIFLQKAVSEPIKSIKHQLVKNFKIVENITESTSGASSYNYDPTLPSDPMSPVELMDLDFNLDHQFHPMDFELMADYLENNQTLTFDGLELEDIKGRNSELNTPVPHLIDTTSNNTELQIDSTNELNGHLQSADPDSQTPEIIDIKEEPLKA